MCLSLALVSAAASDAVYLACAHNRSLQILRATAMIHKQTCTTGKPQLSCAENVAVVFKSIWIAPISMQTPPTMRRINTDYISQV